MRKLLAGIPALFLMLTFVGYAQKAPDKLTIPTPKAKAMGGDVVFPHDAHVKAAKNDCKVCHDKLWPQKADGKVGFAFPHTKAEAAHTSCGFCHHKGGQSFVTVGNCKKCHTGAAAK